VRVYLAPGGDETAGHVARNLKKYCKDHQPVLTGVGVAKLTLEGMRVEIEVAAHLGA
jgi:enamine deaminase RidA (YjgF/YER057c/UK114 family)